MSRSTMVEKFRQVIGDRRHLRKSWTRWAQPWNRMRTLALLIGIGACVASAAAQIKLSDDQLRSRIVGVWYSEDMREITRHAGGRSQYFPDGRFMADYRVSGPGSEQYIRTLGTWRVSGGLFTETVTKVSGAKRSFRTLVRRVVEIDGRHMILAPASGGAPFESWRGKTKLDDSEGSAASIQKKLLTDLESMHVSGYRPIPAGNGMVSWRLDSRKIESAKHR